MPFTVSETFKEKIPVFKDAGSISWSENLHELLEPEEGSSCIYQLTRQTSQKTWIMINTNMKTPKSHIFRESHNSLYTD